MFLVEQANSATRRLVWPYLLGLCPDSAFVVPESDHQNMPLLDEKTCRVVQNDVSRSMNFFDINTHIDHTKRAELRAELTALVHKPLNVSVDPLIVPSLELHYYQGYHDVVAVFQLVLEPKLAEMFVFVACFELLFAGTATIMTFVLLVTQPCTSWTPCESRWTR